MQKHGLSGIWYIGQRPDFTPVSMFNVNYITKLFKPFSLFITINTIFKVTVFKPSINKIYFCKVYFIKSTINQKKEKLSLFSERETEVWIYLDLYCFNKNFLYSEYWSDKAEDIVDCILEMYNNFKNDISNIEERFIETFNEEKEELEIEGDIDNREDLYSKVSLKEIWISRYAYAVIVSIVFDETEDYGYVMNYCDREHPYYSINAESEIEPVEMDYN